MARIKLLRAEGNSSNALEIINRAISIVDRTFGQPEKRAITYMLKAKILHQGGDLAEAITVLSSALREVEKLRPQVGGGPATSARYLENYQSQFDLMVDLQLEMGQIDSALEYLERGMARVLLDQLAAGQIDISKSMPAKIRAGFENRESNLRARIAEYQQRLRITETREDFSRDRGDKEIARLQGLLEQVENDYQEIHEEKMSASPFWRDLLTRGGRPVDLAKIQNALIPPNGLMLLYQVGKEESHLFVVPAANQAAKVMTLQCSEAVASTLEIEPGNLTTSKLQEILLGQEKRAGLLSSLSTSAGPDETLNKLHALWQVLIPEALWVQLLNSSEVIVIPDGALHLLPLEALVVKQKLPGNNVRFWLDAGPVIRYAPSATTLYNLEQRRDVGGATSVLSLSDPVFDVMTVIKATGKDITGKNLTFAMTADSLEETTSDILRGSYELRSGPLIRLRDSAQETQRVQKAFKMATGNPVTTLTRFNATESNLREAFSAKKYIHLATHALVDENRNFLFSSLALTPPSVEFPDPENDGFLQLHEIYDLELPNCELTVLSACETNIGRVYEGEGVFALSRGFLAAGARRVIASQWSVADESTAELIGTFFENIAKAEKDGTKPNYAVILRDAKLRLRNNQKWSSPFHWAPFILIGKH